MAQDKSSLLRSYNSKLAKAETLLTLALLTELAIYPWLFSQAAIPATGKTLIKMALVVGLFGPVQCMISRAIDGTLQATRTATSSVLSLPRIGIHICILAALFVSFYWSMHHNMPWSGVFPRNTQQANAERR